MSNHISMCHWYEWENFTKQKFPFIRLILAISMAHLISKNLLLLIVVRNKYSTGKQMKLYAKLELIVAKHHLMLRLAIILKMTLVKLVLLGLMSHISVTIHQRSQLLQVDHYNLKLRQKLKLYQVFTKYFGSMMQLIIIHKFLH